MFICAAGEPGTGKSVWVSKVAPIYAGKMRTGAIIVDPIGSQAYSRLRHVQTAREAAMVAFHGRQVVVVSRLSVAQMDALCGLLMREIPPGQKRQALLLIIDELRWYATARKTLSNNLILLARGHRNVNVGIIGATQSYGDLSRDLTCSVTHYRIYKCSAPLDLKRMKERLKINPDIIERLWKPPENSGPVEGAHISLP